MSFMNKYKTFKTILATTAMMAVIIFYLGSSFMFFGLRLPYLFHEAPLFWAFLIGVSILVVLIGWFYFSFRQWRGTGEKKYKKTVRMIMYIAAAVFLVETFIWWFVFDLRSLPALLVLDFAFLPPILVFAFFYYFQAWREKKSRIAKGEELQITESKILKIGPKLKILKSKKFLIIGGSAIIVIILFLAGSMIIGNFRKAVPIRVSCNPLTPFVLEGFEANSGGVKPLGGEKCDVYSLPRGFLIKLEYSSSGEVAAAKLALVAGTEGEKKMLNGVSDWVVLEGDSSVFITIPNTNPNGLGILVLPGMNEENEVKYRVKTTIDSGVMLP